MNKTNPARLIAGVCGAFAIFAVSGSTTLRADDSMMSSPKMAMSHKMPMHKMVYACTMCKEYYSPAMAKKMGYKDGMGHKLVKMSSAPAGYTDGSKMSDKMGGKMSGSTKM